MKKLVKDEKKIVKKQKKLWKTNPGNVLLAIGFWKMYFGIRSLW